MMNLPFDPDVYVPRLIEKLVRERQNVGLTEKALKHIQKGIYIEFLAHYYKISSIEELVTLDAKLAEEVKALLPISFPTTREPTQIPPGRPWVNTGPSIFPQPSIISESRDPLKITYETSFDFKTNC